MQFNNLVQSWGLERKDIITIKHLTSFHEMMYRIYQRSDTQQYIYVETEDSYRDGVDDYFRWRYITEDEKDEMIAKDDLRHRTNLINAQSQTITRCPCCGQLTNNKHLLRNNINNSWR